MTAYPQFACGAATFLHLRHGDLHAITGLGRPEEALSTSGQRGQGRRIILIRCLLGYGLCC